MSKRWIQAAIILICAATASCSQKPVETAVAEYAVIKASKTTKTLKSRYSATIRGRQDIDIFAQVSGTITQMCVKEGEEVKKNQVLFVIDQVPYKAALQTALANEEAARATVANARLNRDSRRELLANKVVSEFDAKSAENTLLSAQAQLSLTQAQVMNARNNLSYTEVKSPSNGVVGTLPYRLGTLVSPSMPKPLTTVSDNSEMYVYFSMNERELLDMIRQYGSLDSILRNMPPIDLQLSDKSIYPIKGAIESISGVVDRTTGTVSIRAMFDNPNRLLLSGSTGNIVIPIEKKDCIVIPKKATFETLDKTFAFTVEDGKAKSIPLQVISISGESDYIVEKGLTEGDILIAEGVGLLREGTPVKIKN